MARNEIIIEFKGKNTDLIKAIKQLDGATKGLIKTQVSLDGAGKKEIQSTSKRREALKKFHIVLKAHGSGIKKLKLNTDVYTDALKGNRIALEKVRIATRNHIRGLNESGKSAMFGTNSNRLLDNSFATLRSKILLVNFALGLGIRQLARFGVESSKVVNMERAFTTLAGGTEVASDSLLKLKEATNGTVSEFDLFQQANNAMILGVTKNSDEMAEMFDIAQRLGRALGKDTKQSVESLITGIGRQSRLMLDNIGIVVKSDEAYKKYAKAIGTTSDKLTDAQKKQAFLTATMESARAKVSSLGDEVLSTQDTYDQLRVATEELAVATGNLLTPALETSSGFFTKLLNSFSDYLNITADAKKPLSENATLEEKIAVATAKHSKAVLDLTMFMTRKFPDDERRIKLEKDITRLLGEKILLEAELNKKTIESQQRTKELTKQEKEKLEQDKKANNELKLRNELEEIRENKLTELAKNVAEREKARQQRFMDSIKTVEQNEIVVQNLANAFDALDASQKFAVQGIEDLSNAMAQAIVNGQSMRDAVVNSLKAIATQIIAKAGTYALLNSFFAPSALAGTTAGGGFLNFLIGHSGGLIKDKDIQRFATGGMVRGQDNVPIMAQAGEFIIKRDTVNRVGADSLHQLNQTGSMPSLTVNINGNVIGNEEFVRDVLIPEINKTVQQGLA
tara:strand:- start:674 stop:2716 length:2043 start_codon:yes stop_codon:yes gene_type:complete